MSPFYRWGNWGPEKWNNLPIITKHSSTWVWTRTVYRTPNWSLLTMTWYSLLVTSSPVHKSILNNSKSRPPGKENSLGLGWLTSEKQAHVFKMPLLHFLPWSFSWLGLHSQSCLLANAVAWALWNAWFVDRTMLFFLFHRLASYSLWGQHGPGILENVPEETALSVYLIKFQTPVLKAHICNGHMYWDRWKHKWFSIVSVLLDLTYHPNSIERVEN